MTSRKLRSSPRARLHGALAVAASVVATFLAADARANPTSRLVYVRGPGAEACPDDAEMRRAVATRLGYDPFRPIAETTLTAEIRREKGVFRARVRLVDDAGVERGARDLESRADDCRELTTAMALSMSIAIDPLSMTRPAPPAGTADPPAPAPAPAPAPQGSDASRADAPNANAPNGSAPESSAAPAPNGAPSGLAAPGDRPAGAADARDRDADAARFVLAGGAHVAFGIAPAAAVGLRISAELATRRYGIALEGRFDLPSSSATAEGGRIRTSLAGGALVPCVRVPLAWACGVLLVSRVAAEAVDVTAPRSDGFLFLGAGARLVSAIALPEDFSLRIGGDVLAHPVPFELTVNGRSVHRSSTVSALAGIALAHNF